LIEKCVLIDLAEMMNLYT